MLWLGAFAVLPVSGLPAQAPVPASERAEPVDAPFDEFDFWIGEWRVNNRFLQADASWRDSGTSRARITPVLGGRAVFEEWSGELTGRGRVIGMSLRAFDPSTESWKLLLNWPGGASSFGVLAGRFRHGRGEFLGGGGASLMRYTFSDALPASVRWDSATSADGGASWRTDWIMEFSRTAPRAADDGALFDVPWETEVTSPAECRELDFLRGTWTGVEEVRDDEGTVRERPATLRAAVVVRGWVTVSSFAAEADERFTAYGWVTGRGAWEAWSLDRDDTRFGRALGEVRLGEAAFVDELAGTAARTRLWLTGENELARETAQRTDGEWRVRTLARLTRVDGM